MMGQLPVFPRWAKRDCVPNEEVQLLRKVLFEGLNGPGRRIRCPRCKWHPHKNSSWYCGPGCWHSWNTFDTGGVCPKCKRQWTETECKSCKRWSPHVDWYVSDGEARQ
jgi:hypothetical protein